MKEAKLRAPYPSPPGSLGQAVEEGTPHLGQPGPLKAEGQRDTRLQEESAGHGIDEETGSKKGSDLPQVAEPMRGRAGTRPALSSSCPELYFVRQKVTVRLLLQAAAAQPPKILLITENVKCHPHRYAHPHPSWKDRGHT